MLARVRLVSDIERLEVASDTAVPFGLITSEFITNSLKYAFGDGPGVIGLRVEAAGSGPGAGEVRVTLWDDGRGLPAERSGGTGLGLIGGLARQVGASAAWSGRAVHAWSCPCRPCLLVRRLPAPLLSKVYVMARSLSGGPLRRSVP